MLESIAIAKSQLYNQRKIAKFGVTRSLAEQYKNIYFVCKRTVNFMLLFTKGMQSSGFQSS